MHYQDQIIKETAVKIQLMERRIEASKRQADVVTDLEEHLGKARKQEKAYEEAMEQLQADLDHLEQENGRLKQSLNAPERQGLFFLVVVVVPDPYCVSIWHPTEWGIGYGTARRKYRSIPFIGAN